ncbi:MAG: phosphoglucosamine mutase [Melioribacteraceae bacterium]|nr:phosphoglucosamine mutase [Melioribacteraceae bacterium]MCF8355089.1 phosphoglucosamine mutase [Melioribacteraceae bacterium]MCF8395057.1 phosphoglucosamine mutase [Melioribacteraceae bacterium]MCF8420307.1 phosphoglucosamine mutase [Melioribacteraceae bacterium]
MPTLMVSVSGIRGIVGDGLDPHSIAKYASAYADFCGAGKIVVGSDGRISGEMVKQILTGTLAAKGNDVIDIGICPTPTVLYNVRKLGAVGGISISASHNPNEWNALKLLNNLGEFMTAAENKLMLDKMEVSQTEYKKWNELGKITRYEEGLQNHMNDVLNMQYIDVDAIKKRKFRVLLDCVNGAGSYIMPELLTQFGCEVIELNCEKNGIFPRLPEPIPENLTETIKLIKENDVDLGIVVDPDVDRLVLLTEDGEPFIEENTITQAVKFVLSKTNGDVVVNLSTTRAVEDVASEAGCKTFRSPVGEANVVELMKKTGAVIGGEGSGGVIYPAVHYGRDALVGTAITLQHLLEFGGKMSELKSSLPQYSIVKKKIGIGKNNPDELISKLVEKYSDQKINTDDGLRIDFEDHWVHLRKSNTEPILRCIAEAETIELAENYTKKYFDQIKELLD